MGKRPNTFGAVEDVKQLLYMTSSLAISTGIEPL